MSDIVRFSLFLWIIYPMLEMYLSNTWLNLNKQNIIVLAISAIIFLFAGLVAFVEHTIYNYPQHIFDIYLIVIVFVIFCFLIVCDIKKCIGNPKILSCWSRNMTDNYII